MKIYHLVILTLVMLVTVSCKKERECECTSLFYDAEGYYIGSNDDMKYMVKNQEECNSYNKTTATEVTNCHLDDHH